MQNKMKKKKRYFTLIELMIVMILIGSLIGVLAYKYQGSLNEGKAFKTKIAMEKLESFLSMSIAENPRLLDNIESEWRQIIAESPQVKNPTALIQDGWGYDFRVSAPNGMIQIESDAYNNYKRSTKTLFGDDK